jgi:N6-adenosine-specific RNA methylase IME4
MADCPWQFATWSAAGRGKSADSHYDCMSLADIKALPVGQLAAKDCALFMWATWPLLPRAHEVMAAWGFTYATGGAWHKTTRHGKTAFGTGYRVRCASEPFLLGFIGNPKNSRGERNVITGLVREHSRKPDEAFSWCERYLPDARRVELFSRERREGWDAFGFETGKFNVAV